MGNLIQNDEIKLRPACLYDALILYKWVMDPESIKNSIKGNVFSFEHHFNWLQKKLKSKKCYIFILESKFPIGQIRFEKNNDEWVISYSIDENFRNQGMGQMILRLGLEKMGKGTYLAKVKKTNIPSIKIFNKMNFEEVINLTEPEGILYFKYKNE